VKPRTIVFDLFGDHLRYVGGEARLQPLCDLLEVFGVGESTSRVVLSRLRKEGWFDTRRDGRLTVYSLTPKSWHLLDEGRTRIFDRLRDPWDGQWRMVIYGVAEPDRPERERLRRTLAWLGFGPLAAATWVSPHPRLPDVEAALGDTSAARLELLTCHTRGRDADRDMATRCWDLRGLGQDYAEFVASLESLPPVDVLATIPGREALRMRVELVSTYRAFPFRDPDLPEELLPEGWPGRRAHELFVRAHDALAAPADNYVRSVLERHAD
jgi:phenylacetic acid degradation operon negative regulatory protein